MSINKPYSSYRMLVLIATTKLAEKAAELFLKLDVPIQYRLNAQGTASSDIMDTLGFGSVDKCLLISMLPEEFASTMIGTLHTQLRLDAVNSGIAFTVPITGASNIVLDMMNKTKEKNITTENGKGETVVTDKKYSLVAAIVDRGFAGDVMDAAKAAGAGGGTIVHSRSIEDEDAISFWGFSLREEKEMVLILADHANKINIMSAISEKCGMNTNAKGMVVSLPVDSVMGI